MLPKANVELNLCRDAEASGSLEPDSTGHVWALETLETTRALGRSLARELPREAILLLSGPLGAGKTSLVQGLAEGLGISEPITSPTFALAQHYPQGQPQLMHLDLYRLEDTASADELFLQEEEEARAVGALMAVEWPERLGLELPEAWRLELCHQDEGRLAQLTPPRNCST
ncbi:tRNA (adenosine(37)-N6)-threonylcarbamoyltransferase complex ATPase subunit type 1 TsaE [Synechococcus sp. MU1643]|uniref:tRNA (adenosine(37)-N6)-threonylcarbamoyltransferase complex ATPase subunit type 1 TsaE n=1 Tax=Synechococcus sp. MU1643 TaxID=2508349 RepID=UPI001CF7F36E|nr:tRNA (adenosine(37)-N6)-threonylcarbamoyltransferase complex ATPase subunit type 1 TsaE [Synechococcus sp. MU1643]